MVVKAYCLYGFDWVPPTVAQTTMVENSLANYGLMYATNSGSGLYTPAFTPIAQVIPNQYTIITKAQTNKTDTSILFEYSQGKNTVNGFLLSVESLYWYNTLYSQSLAGIYSDVDGLTSVIPRMIVATANTTRQTRVAKIRVNDVQEPYPYTSPYGSIDNAILQDEYTTQPLYIGTRKGSQFPAEIFMSGILLLNRELDYSEYYQITDFIDQKYIASVNS